MSDEGRGRTLKEIISDATEQELAEYQEDTLSVKELKVMLDKQASRAKARRLKIISATAVFVVAIFGAIMVFDNFSTDVQADKNAPEEIITDDGVVIEDGGWGSSSEDVIEITDWEEITEVKHHIPELIVPEYIPEGYEFKSLVVDTYEDIKCEYLFSKKGVDDIEIHQFIQSNNLNSFNIEASSKIIESKNGDIYIENVGEINIATIMLSGGSIVKLWSSIDEKSIVKIFNELIF